jgi:hypothetical protein
MDPAVVGALSAVLGSLVGGSATIATAWVSQRTQNRRKLVRNEIRKRETLYSEYVAECSRLAIDALDHTLDDPSKVFNVYALQNRIRLIASEPVVAAADDTLHQILSTYFGPNVSRDEMRTIALTRQVDPLKPFAVAARLELQQLTRSA